MAVTTQIYNDFVTQLGLGSFNMGSETFRILLVGTGYTFDPAHSVLTDVNSSELANANGYTTGGAVIANTVWSNSGANWTLDGDDVTWTAVGGNIGPAKGAIIYIPSAGDYLLGYIEFDGAQTAGVDTQMRVTFNVNGIIQFTKL